MTAGKIQLTKGQAVLIVVLFLVVVVGVGVLAGLLGPPCTTSVDNGTQQGQPNTGLVSVSIPEEKPWLDHRLPAHVIPLHYDLKLFPDFYDNHTHFYGDVIVQIRITKETHHILIHHRKMNITRTALKDLKSKKNIAIKKTFPYPENEYWVVETETAIPKDSVVALRLNFEGSLTNGIVGLYRSTYVNSVTGERRYLATSKFQPTDARKAFPCFDEPGIKSTFTVTLVHRPEYTALSNMPEAERKSVANGMVETRFERSVPMVTYLACFIVCDFESLSATTQTGVPFRVFATPDRVEQARYSLDVGVRVLDYFTDYFNVSYPLPKLDMIAIPDFVSGAMEHWGLITYRETNMLYDSSLASPANQQRVVTVVAHELAHMWFGNLVTMKWWDDLWLNEGFASFMEYSAVQHVHPDWAMPDQFLTLDLNMVMAKDATVTSHPIVMPVEHPDQITEVFDAISYSKGASVIRMLESFMGADNFRDGLQKYMKAFLYKTTVTDDLWSYLEKVPGAPEVKAIMDTWTRQMGFPVLDVEYDRQSVSLEQSRFLLDPEGDISQPPSPYNYIWRVPVTYKTSGGQSGQYWLNTRRESFTLPSELDLSEDWIKFNIHQTGYFRVDYPVSHWRQFGRILRQNMSALDPADRSSLISDIFAFANSGKRSYDLALDLVKYLHAETHYVPWRTFSTEATYIGHMLRDGRHFGKWQKFMRSLLTPVMQRIGLEDEGDHLTKQLRAALLGKACEYGDPQTLVNVTNLFSQWLNNNQTVGSSLRTKVYMYGMQEVGGEAAWDAMWRRYKAAVVPQEKRRLLVGLTMTRRIWLLARMLSYSMDESKVRGQDFFALVIYVSYNPVGRPLVWNWIRANWPALVDRFGLNHRYLGRLVPTVVRRFNTDFQLRQVEEFFARYPEAGAGQLGRQQVLENIRTNIAWMTLNERTIATWLDRNVQ